jgi:multidrug efflux pump subunit AcrA (membrane-fusion protein)
VAPPASQGNQGNQGGGAPHATIAMTVTMTDPAASGGLDQAPVTVGITNETHPAVLAVPVTSLLALAEGGYAVKVVSGATGTLVPVTTGLFGDDGMVEVTGAVHPGDRVEVPKG